MGKNFNLIKQYQDYCFNCFCEGDIWNENNRLYTFEEWKNKNYPKYGGIKIK